MSDVVALVVAAGHGTRFGGQKQFASLGAQTVAAHSVSLCRSVANTVILIVPSDYEGDGEGADIVVHGGQTRSDSVRCGLALVDGADVVLVHDAARPYATPDLFLRVVTAISGGADAVVPGLPVTDTVKRWVHDGVEKVVADTLDRASLVSVQTPQAFTLSALQRAHDGNKSATDDAALVEEAGGRVVIVEGESSNIKITVPEDLKVVS